MNVEKVLVQNSEDNVVQFSMHIFPCVFNINFNTYTSQLLLLTSIYGEITENNVGNKLTVKHFYYIPKTHRNSQKTKHS